MTAQWLPRAGDRMVLLAPDGQPVTSWQVETCTPVTGPERFALVITPVLDEAAAPADAEVAS